MPKWATKKSNDSFFRLSRTQYNSPAWRALTANQMNLYLFSTWHRLNSRQHPRNDYPDDDRFKPDTVFYMNRAIATATGLYAESNSRFYDDCKRLVELGFWDIIANGKNGFNKNVYAMSERWKVWNPVTKK